MNQPTAPALSAEFERTPRPLAVARDGVVRLDVAGIGSADGLLAAPASLLIAFVRGTGEILAVGSPSEVDRHPAATSVIAHHRWPSAVVIPGLVNAHAHLDLTHIGPRPFDPDRGFVGWVDMVRGRRLKDPTAIRSAVMTGVELSLRGGTVAIGDIAGAVEGRMNAAAAHALRDSEALHGVAFLEYFALPREGPTVRERLDAQVRGLDVGRFDRPLRVGLQPHAPYSVGRDGYAWALERAGINAWPVSTHAAETQEESDFIAQGRGPFRDFLAGLGLWNERVAGEVAHGRTPIDHLLDSIGDSPCLLAHGNALTDDNVTRLARTRATVVYCPRASAYFGFPSRLGPHRYRDLLSAGVPVALGTDSIINLPSGSESSRISILDEMRLLHSRDRTAPGTLLCMATTHGARALGLDASGFTLRAETRPLGLVAVEVSDRDRVDNNPVAWALRSDAPPVLVYRRPLN